MDRAGHVARGVEQGVLVALDDPDLGIVQVLLDPVGRDESVGVRVAALFDRSSHDEIS